MRFREVKEAERRTFSKAKKKPNITVKVSKYGGLRSQCDYYTQS